MTSRPLDLNSLPPDLRRVVEQQLSKLPPQAREKLLREGSPIVDRMIARLGGAVPPPLPGTASHRPSRESVQRATQNVQQTAERASDVAERLKRLVPKGHYNATVRPGDGAG